MGIVLTQKTHKEQTKTRKEMTRTYIQMYYYCFV